MDSFKVWHLTTVWIPIFYCTLAVFTFVWLWVLCSDSLWSLLSWPVACFWFLNWLNVFWLKNQLRSVVVVGWHFDRLFCRCRRLWYYLLVISWWSFRMPFKMCEVFSIGRHWGLISGAGTGTGRVIVLFSVWLFEKWLSNVKAWFNEVDVNENGVTESSP